MGASRRGSTTRCSDHRLSGARIASTQRDRCQHAPRHRALRATGDLSRRKLLPGLAHLALSALAPDIQVVGTSLEDLTEDEFRNFAKEAVTEFSHHPLTDMHWDSFAERLTYIPQSAGAEGWARRFGSRRRSWVDPSAACTT